MLPSTDFRVVFEGEEKQKELTDSATKVLENPNVTEVYETPEKKA